MTKEERKKHSGRKGSQALSAIYSIFFLERGERELWISYYLDSLVMLLQGLVHSDLDGILHHTVALRENGTEMSREQSVDS